MKIILKEVVSRRDWRNFICFPEKLFENDPLFIPSLHSDEKDTLFSDRNPAYEYCDAKFWLAYSDGEVVGRVGAIINRKSNELWNEKCVRFGWFDFIEDFDVFKCLIDKVAEYGRSNGMTKIIGPMGFTDMDKECWVTDGFENEQNITTLYNPRYYIDFISRYGFDVDCEWQQFKIPASQDVPEKVSRINKLISERYKVRLVEFTRAKDILPYGHKIFDALNDAFHILYGFVPLSGKEIDLYVKRYFSFIAPELVKIVVDENDDVVGFAIATPSLTDAFKKIKGSLFPFGWIRALRSLKVYNEVDLLLNGVRTEWQNRGIHAIYHEALNKTLIERGVKIAYSNPQIIGNKAVTVWNAQYDCEPYFKRAVFCKIL